MARTRNHGRTADPADQGGGDAATDAGELLDETRESAAPRWLVSIPGCHPEDLVVDAADELAAVEAYKARLGILQLPVAAVVTPAIEPAEAEDPAPAPE